VAVVCLDMFISGLSGCVYDTWQWSVWMCLLVISLDMLMIRSSGLSGYVYGMW
jgi:hypothetical protein